MNRIKRLFYRKKKREPEWPQVNIKAQIDTIEYNESNRDIGLGSRIHYFSFQEFELQLDRDITGMYRVVVTEGNNRRFSFTIKCKYGDYAKLGTCFEEILQYLSGDRRIADLPNHDLIKGHYYGN